MRSQVLERQMLKKTLMILLILYALSLASCVKPPDVSVCVELVKDKKGFCAYTISDKEETLEGQQWKDLKLKSLIIPAQSWAEIKSFILKICEKTKECDLNQTQKKIQKIDNAPVDKPPFGFNDK